MFRRTRTENEKAEQDTAEFETTGTALESRRVARRDSRPLDPARIGGDPRRPSRRERRP
jgi:hypothetical protein